MGFIYCLYSTQDGEPRYIGSTEDIPAILHKKYLTKALENEDKSQVYVWMREVFRTGHLVESYVLQQDVIPEELRLFEKYWMKQFPNLINAPVTASQPAAPSAIAAQIIRAIKGRTVGLQ